MFEESSTEIRLGLNPLAWSSHRVQTVTILATIGIATAGTTGTEATKDVQRNATTGATVVADRDHTAENGILVTIIVGARKETYTGI